MSKLSAGGSIGAAIGTAGLVFAIYAFTVPNIAVVHASDPNDKNVESARKKAVWAAALASAGVAALAKDYNPFILGGGAIIVSDFYVRHANATHPVTGDLVDPAGYSPSQSTEYGTEFTQVQEN
jgi:hypothetical protein